MLRSASSWPVMRKRLWEKNNKPGLSGPACEVPLQERLSVALGSSLGFLLGTLLFQRFRSGGLGGVLLWRFVCHRASLPRQARLAWCTETTARAGHCHFFLPDAMD